MVSAGERGVPQGGPEKPYMACEMGNFAVGQPYKTMQEAMDAAAKAADASKTAWVVMEVVHIIEPKWVIETTWSRRG